jgi:hypothetical protein
VHYTLAHSDFSLRVIDWPGVPGYVREATLTTRILWPPPDLELPV